MTRIDHTINVIRVEEIYNLNNQIGSKKYFNPIRFNPRTPLNKQKSKNFGLPKQMGYNLYGLAH